jgi:acyl-coenzyme A synthetase/AMP-(fatty) acid ligase
MENTEPWADVRPADDLARRYRERGFWRDLTPAADLRRWATETPDAVAVAEYRAGPGMRRVTYREYADPVDRVTAVLGELGVGQGDAVTVQLPNWWQVNAVVLACARLGAVAAPMVLFTSGTTGTPKAVLHSFNTLCAGYAAFAARGGLSSADVLYTPHSLGHVAGQVVRARSSLASSL